jgi:beta-fructofuranosidase
MNRTWNILLILLTAQSSLTAAAAAGDPFRDAVAVWRLGDVRSGLRVEGDVQLGVELPGTEREASRRRGGNGRAARFNGGWLRASLPGGQPLSLRGKEMTLYARLQDPAGEWVAPLFARDDPNDSYGMILYGGDGHLHYVWRTEPLAQRTGVSPVAGRYGFNGESNDQHHLAVYEPGAFAVSTLTLDGAGMVTLFHNGHKTSGSIDMARQNIGDALVRVGAKHNDEEYLEGDLAEIIIYDRVVSEPERLGIESGLRCKWKLDGAPGPPEQPLPKAGLVLHLDAGDSDTQPGPLAVWRDKSGHGRSVTQSDRAKQPEVVAGALGGKPVVRFGGRQYLDGAAVLPAGCRQLTFVAVWKRNHSNGSEVIVEQSSLGAGRRACLLTTGAEPGQSPDRAAGVLRLRVPAQVIGPTTWHDIIARFRGPNLELFVDGVLVDEEWPHGELYQFSGPFLIGAGYERRKLRTGFRGQIERVALWSRALKDDEVTMLAGGAEEVGRRDVEMFGPPQTSMQYWKPRGYNAWAGDCMPFFHDGTFHLFYLFDRRHHGSKWGQGAHQYAHASTRDLIHWEHHPLAVPIVEQWECSMGTGDGLWHDGTYYMFYTDCGGRCEYRDKPQRGSWIFAATSTDGIHFHKDLKPLVPGGDCTVFRDPATGLFHLVRGGGNRLVSRDLRHWEETAGEFVRRRPGTSDECPHLFEWNAWFYFILGANGLWKSRQAVGPWEETAPNIYDGLYVPKVAEFTGNRRILAGALFEHGWAGHLALRELVQFPDGSLGMKFPPELIPAAGEPLKLGGGSTIRITAPGKFARASLTNVPRNMRLTLRVVPQPGAKAFGLCVRGQGDYDGGCELRFDPAGQRAQYGVPQNHGPAPDATGRIAAGRDYALQNVERLDQPFTLDVIVKDDIVDACIDQRRTMITRREPEPTGDRLFLFARDGEVTFESVEVRPLK